MITFWYILGVGSRQYFWYAKSPGYSLCYYYCFTGATQLHSYIYHYTYTAIHYLSYPDLLLQYWPCSSVSRDLFWRSWVLIPLWGQILFDHGGYQISFHQAEYQGDLVYRQYCLLLAPKIHQETVIITLLLFVSIQQNWSEFKSQI